MPMDSDEAYDAQLGSQKDSSAVFRKHSDCSTECSASEASASISNALAQVQGKLLAEHVLHLAHDKDGCLRVHQALELAEADEDRWAIAEGLKGHVWEVSRCPHANHVLQKYIVTMRPSACVFILEELLQRGPEAICRFARHKYQTRILQRLLEHLWPSQVAELVQILLRDAVGLMMHRFGSYVMQSVMEFGQEGQQQQLLLAMAGSIGELGRNNDACMVIGRALELGTPEMTSALLDAVLGDAGAIAAMSHMRRGHTAVVSALDSASPEQLARASVQLRQQLDSLVMNRYGRIVLHCVKEMAEQ